MIQCLFNDAEEVGFADFTRSAAIIVAVRIASPNGLRCTRGRLQICSIVYAGNIVDRAHGLLLK